MAVQGSMGQLEAVRGVVHGSTGQYGAAKGGTCEPVRIWPGIIQVSRSTVNAFRYIIVRGSTGLGMGQVE